MSVLGVLVVGYFLASLFFYFHFLRPAGPGDMADRARKRAAAAAAAARAPISAAELLEDGDLEKLPCFTDERPGVDKETE